ncbi:MAG: (2Fe-2S)-binding protein [Rhodospirillales bacterium]|nr:(2Fe-2S)-binding protein [Rhodospirillales bacterium]
MKKLDLKFTINGRNHVGEAPPRMTLVDYLRDVLNLTGTHVGCEHGVCGACTIRLDGEPVRACLMFAVQADGHEISTVEGLVNEDGSLSILQDSFWEAHAMQCGYCTPGMLMTASALLDENPAPSTEDIRDAISGNLCRCTGYQQIVEAIELAAKQKYETGGEGS